MASNRRRSVRYAQNVLTNRSLIDRLLDRSGIDAGDTVLEIGAGGGAITERLARRCRRVVAIERDPRLADRLRRRFAGCPSVAIHEGDFLCLPLPDTRYKVFANIPFNITTAIVTRLTAAPRPPEEAHLVVQREAADRFLGQSSNRGGGTTTVVNVFALHPDDWTEMAGKAERGEIAHEWIARTERG